MNQTETLVDIAGQPVVLTYSSVAAEYEALRPLVANTSKPTGSKEPPGDTTSPAIC